jgi:hypothetical protein
MLNEIQSFAERHLPFACETTLSGRSYMGLLRRLKAQEYKVRQDIDLGVSAVLLAFPVEFGAGELVRNTSPHD